MQGDVENWLCHHHAWTILHPYPDVSNSTSRLGVECCVWVGSTWGFPDRRGSTRTKHSSLHYSLTHSHRSIGYRNRNPQSLIESAVRLMYLRVYDNRDNSHQSVSSPSLSYSLTHTHNTLPTPTILTITCTQVLWFLESLTRPTVSCYVTTRTRLTVCLPEQPSVCETF
jgi:hypothetical protein